MNRTELVGEVSKITGLTKQQAEKGLEAFEYAVKSALRRNETVRITGFGTFKARNLAARRGRNPQTGAPVRIKAKKSIAFSAGTRLKAQLNSRAALPTLIEQKPSPRHGKKQEGPEIPVEPGYRARAAMKGAPGHKAVPARLALPTKKVAAGKATDKKVLAGKVTAKKTPQGKPSRQGGTGR